MAELNDLVSEQAKVRSLGKFVKAWNPAILGVREPNPRTVNLKDIVADLDIEIPLRDGVKVRGNIFRPISSVERTSKLPIVLNFSLYGKDGGTDISIFPPSAGLDRARISDEYIFEAADPGWWCRHGYAVASVDARGSYMSDGDKSYYSRDVGLDGYDIVEWLGERDWSNGKVALYGASGYAMVQWLVAPERPPHLAAIVPIDGMTDIYREMARKGGILESQFTSVYPMFYNWGKGEVEDVEDGPRNHPFFDAYWESKIPAVQKIECPTYIICSWGDHGIHTRGTLSAYKRIPAEHKYLEIHQQQKWEWAATEESLLRQKAFLDTYLLGKETEVKFWPRVRWAMREAYYIGEWRTSTDFPFPNTEYEAFYPTPARGLSRISQSQEHSIGYDAKNGEVEFELPITSSLEFAGHAKLRLWIELKGAENADLHITLRKTDRSGKEVFFPWLTVVDTGPIAFGWLKVSRRELDERFTTSIQPYHKHARDIPVKPGEIVPVEIEIQPTSCRFRPGDRLRLVVSGHDYGTFPQRAPIARHSNEENIGSHILHFGGKFDTLLQLPVIPPVVSSLEKEKPMVKMSMLACRVPGWSDDIFLQEYSGAHAEMTKKVAEVVPVLRGYLQTVSVPHLEISIPKPYRSVAKDGVRWDCNTTLTWTTLSGLWGSFQAPEYKASAGKHIFVNESQTIGVLCSTYKDLMIDPILFEKRQSGASVIATVFLAKSSSYSSDQISPCLDRRVDAVRAIIGDSGLLRYVLNREVTPADTNDFFRGTAFMATDWHATGAMEQWYFANEDAARRFLEAPEVSKAFAVLPSSFNADRSLMTLGKENIVVAKDVIQ